MVPTTNSILTQRQVGRRGFTIRLKGSSLSRGPNILEVKTISSIPVCIIFVFCFGSNHVFFTMPLTKDLYRSMSAKDWSEWRWAFSFSGVENWLFLDIMCGTKRLNLFFQVTRGQWGRLLNKYVMGVWRDNFIAGFLVIFIVTVFALDIVAAAQHCSPQNAYRDPQWWFLKDISTLRHIPRANGLNNKIT